MISVSSGFKTAIVAASRKTAARVVFEIIDVDAYTDASVSVTAEAAISHKDQMINKTREMSYKYATFENNYWKLDGSFVIPPKVSEVGFETGWWSDALSDSNGDYSVPQVVTITFTADQSSIGVTIFFDTLTNEYAKDFVIDVYDAADVLIHEETVTNNADAIYVLDQNLPDYRKIIITITAWATGYRRARITEIEFGVVKQYDGNDIVNMSVIEEIDPTCDVCTSNEFKVTLNNKDKLFNILNVSGVYAYLQRGQEFKTYLAVQKADTSYEYVPMGIFYLTEWQSDEGALTATLTARDKLDMLSKSNFMKGEYQTDDLYAIAEDVLADAGVTDYSIDAALQSINSSGYIPILSHRDALQRIAMAGMAALYCDRAGNIVIKQLSSTPLTETIDMDNMYDSPKINLNKLINTVEVEVSNYVARGSSETVYEGTVDVSGTKDVWITYKSGPCQTLSSVVTGGSVNSETYYANAALLNITAAGSVTITTTGTVLEQSKSIYSVRDGSAPADEATLSIKIENELVTDNTMADNIAGWLLAEYGERYLYEVNARMNPAYESGDIVAIEDSFDEDKDVRITKQEFNFNGALYGKINGKAG